MCTSGQVCTGPCKSTGQKRIQVFVCPSPPQLLGQVPSHWSWNSLCLPPYSQCWDCRYTQLFPAATWLLGNFNPGPFTASALPTETPPQLLSIQIGRMFCSLLLWNTERLPNHTPFICWDWMTDEQWLVMRVFEEHSVTVHCVGGMSISDL